MDITKWATDNLLADFLKKPIVITVENISDKYIIKGTLQVLKKERGKDEYIPKNIRLDTEFEDTGVVEVHPKQRSKTNTTRNRRIRTPRS